MLYIDNNQVFTVFFHRQCESRGNGRSETSLTFLFEDTAAAKCGVERKEEVKYSFTFTFCFKTKFQGVYTNTVVVQHHPVIQRKGDRAVQLFCFFETGDKLVTNSYDVLAE